MHAVIFRLWYSLVVVFIGCVIILLLVMSYLLVFIGYVIVIVFHPALERPLVVQTHAEEVRHGSTLLIKMAEVTLIDFSYLTD